ncbi:MAG: class I SAM-dependent methyltransferase [Lentisphaerae bacterium]|nr:class I SAM-dependent methyltransferase [Lentisphaerota bacterium]
MKTMLRNWVLPYYNASGDSAYAWAGKTIADGGFHRVLDVGCGDGTQLLRHFTKRPEKLYGIEGNPTLADQARQNGFEVTTFDLNGPWPYPDRSFDAVHASQVIEHLHNTRQFLLEVHRVLTPGGLLVMTSENLSSFLNLGALILGYAPFSLQNVCGWHVGNPLGLHAGSETPVNLSRTPLHDPIFSGASGHIRVLTALQAEALLVKAGFVDAEVRTAGLMPLPGWLGRPLETVFKRRGHWLMARARKPV